MKLLFHRWQLDDKGIPRLENFVPIEANPTTKRENTESFFEVQDDLVIAQPNFFGTTRWVLGQSIVPIVTIGKDHKLIAPIGTGFFISCDGFLITAGHVLTHLVDRQKHKRFEGLAGAFDLRDIGLGIMLQHNVLHGDNAYQFIPIDAAQIFANEVGELPWEQKALRPIYDIAVCKVSQPDKKSIFQPLSCFQPSIKGYGTLEEKRLLVLGYSGMQEFQVGDNAHNESDFKYLIHASAGKVTKRFPQNHFQKNVPSPGPCFEMNARLTSGMSGSPIFDDERIYVHGVASSSYDLENVSQVTSYGTILSLALQTPLRIFGNRSFYERMKDPNSGIANIHAPGDM